MNTDAARTPTPIAHRRRSHPDAARTPTPIERLLRRKWNWALTLSRAIRSVRAVPTHFRRPVVTDHLCPEGPAPPRLMGFLRRRRARPAQPVTSAQQNHCRVPRTAILQLSPDPELGGRAGPIKDLIVRSRASLSDRRS